MASATAPKLSWAGEGRNNDRRGRLMPMPSAKLKSNGGARGRTKTTSDGRPSPTSRTDVWMSIGLVTPPTQRNATPTTTMQMRCHGHASCLSSAPFHSSIELTWLSSCFFGTERTLLLKVSNNLSNISNVIVVSHRRSYRPLLSTAKPH